MFTFQSAFILGEWWRILLDSRSVLETEWQLNDKALGNRAVEQLPMATPVKTGLVCRLMPVAKHFEMSGLP